MQNYSKQELEKTLKNMDILPLKKLGQNFLIDRQAVNKIITSSNINKNTIVLEIGPGLGTLTDELCKNSKKVTAVEKDSRMCKILGETFKDYRNLRIINGDILKMNSQFSGAYKVIANLPFYITSPVIRKFLESDNPPKEMVLVVQKELAQRICAEPPKMNLLAVSVQIYAKPEIIAYIPKTAFWPKPKVDAAILKITAIEKRFEKDFMDIFFKVVKTGFSHPRKQILNNFTKGLAPALSKGLVLSSSSLKTRQSLNDLSKDVKLNKEKIVAWLLGNKIQPSQRAETLPINDWINLTKTFQIVA